MKDLLSKGSSGNLVTTFLGNPKKGPFLLSVRNNFMVKKQAKMAKTAMYVQNNFSKIGSYSMHMEEFCYFGRPADHVQLFFPQGNATCDRGEDFGSNFFNSAVT